MHKLRQKIALRLPKICLLAAPKKQPVEKITLKLEEPLRGRLRKQH